jgi:hypothetical protein
MINGIKVIKIKEEGDLKNVPINENINNKTSKKNNNIINDLKEILYDSFNKMNKGFNYIDQMLIPVNPNTDQKVLQLNI